jgi:arsenical resistance protein ArsH
VQAIRELSAWSDGQFWCSPEQHGAVTAAFKNQIDWIPLSTGSVRPTQGRTLALAQVVRPFRALRRRDVISEQNGGSQSFNTVNSLRLLGRWMRMFTIPNQSSLPIAWTAFTEEGRLKPSSNRDRLVDVCEEVRCFPSNRPAKNDVCVDSWSRSRPYSDRTRPFWTTATRSEKKSRSTGGYGRSRRLCLRLRRGSSSCRDDRLT